MKRFFIGLGFGLIVGGVIGWFCHPSPCELVKTEVKVDTIVMRDVIHDTVWRTRTIVRELPVHHTDTIHQHTTDTVRVEIPISTYVFQDSTYRAEVSGYEVTLDRMEVYQRTITERYDKRPRWALTGGVGVGVDYSGNVRPYLGVSFGYVIWSK